MGNSGLFSTLLTDLGRIGLLEEPVGRRPSLYGVTLRSVRPSHRAVYIAGTPTVHALAEARRVPYLGVHGRHIPGWYREACSPGGTGSVPKALGSLL